MLSAITLKAVNIKPIFTHISHGPEERLIIVERDVPYFNTPFHFHPECELVYILEGTGKRIVGDSVEVFGPGDLVFLGSNISHVWYSDEAFKESKGLHSRAIVVYFDKGIFGDTFYALNETQCIKKLMHQAERGMHFKGSPTLLQLILQIPDTVGLERIIILLRLLQELASTNDYRLLASIGYHNTYDTKDNHKIDEVFLYVSRNFHQNITLEDMAVRCHMARHSFCRFFKKRTQKTFVEFLNEFRISHAKKLLVEQEEITIREVAFECGFNNISNFNKAFKQITGITPKQHKEKYR